MNGGEVLRWWCWVASYRCPSPKIKTRQFPPISSDNFIRSARPAPVSTLSRDIRCYKNMKITLKIPVSLLDFNTFFFFLKIDPSHISSGFILTSFPSFIIPVFLYRWTYFLHHFIDFTIPRNPIANILSSKLIMRPRIIINLFQILQCLLFNRNFVASENLEQKAKVSNKGSQQSSNSLNPSCEPTQPADPPISLSPSNTPTRLCFDPNKVDLGVMCPLVYKPVCGCNNITYSNDCEAEREGIWECSRSIYFMVF